MAWTYPPYVGPRVTPPSCEVSAHLITRFGSLPVTNKCHHPSGCVPLGHGSDLIQSVPTESGSPVILFYDFPNSASCLKTAFLYVSCHVHHRGWGGSHPPTNGPTIHPRLHAKFRSVWSSSLVPIGNKQNNTQTNTHFYSLDTCCMNPGVHGRFYGLLLRNGNGHLGKQQCRLPD